MTAVFLNVRSTIGIRIESVEATMRMTWLVIRFNWHYFAIAGAACVAGVTLALLVNNSLLRMLLAGGVSLALYFMTASVLASYLVYDASDLYKLNWWPTRFLTQAPMTGLLVHAGFDPASEAIRRKYPEMKLRLLDFFDEKMTTEASIQRAHRMNPSVEIEESVSPDQWPVESSSQDAIFILNAAHELRKESERIAFFSEAERVLKSTGRIIVIEQLRNAANFACFGFATFHFLSRKTWLRSFGATALTVTDEFRITPWLRAFVLK